MPSPIRTSLLLPAIDSVLMWPTRLLSGTACGTFWLRAAPAHSAWVSPRAAIAGKSSSALEAYRVYDDPADLLRHLDEVGVRAHPDRRGSETERSADCYG